MGVNECHVGGHRDILVLYLLVLSQEALITYSRLKKTNKQSKQTKSKQTETKQPL